MSRDELKAGTKNRKEPVYEIKDELIVWKNTYLYGHIVQRGKTSLGDIVICEDNISGGCYVVFNGMRRGKTQPSIDYAKDEADRWFRSSIKKSLRRAKR